MRLEARLGSERTGNIVYDAIAEVAFISSPSRR
jgi:hypothetical protein